MSTSYHIYRNDGAGGPVDYSTVIATTASLSYNVGPLAFGSDWTFAVRAFDTVSTLQEQNSDARVQIKVGATGLDLAGLPLPPLGLGALATAAGHATVSWAYSPIGQGGAPVGFHVYVGTPTPNYATPAVTVPYLASTRKYSAILVGLTGGTHYQAAVRAYNASGEEANTVVAPFIAATTGPLPVAALAATLLS